MRPNTPGPNQDGYDWTFLTKIQALLHRISYGHSGAGASLLQKLWVEEGNQRFLLLRGGPRPFVLWIPGGRFLDELGEDCRRKVFFFTINKRHYMYDIFMLRLLFDSVAFHHIMDFLFVHLRDLSTIHFHGSRHTMNRSPVISHNHSPTFDA